MIHVIAVITARPGQRENILKAFRDNVPAVRAEAGCIEYGAAVDVANGPNIQAKYGPDTFVVVEKWESMAAVAAHAGASHMAAYAAKVKDYVAERKIHILEPA